MCNGTGCSSRHLIVRDESGYRDFAEQAAPALFRSAYLLSGDWHLAQDLVQDTLARMFAIWGRAAGFDSPVAYAHTVLTRRFLSLRRRRSAGEIPSEHVPDVPDAADRDPDAELRLTLIAALATLPARDRAVLVLRYLADLPVAEVAQAVGRSESAVRVQAMRALARLREHLPDLIEH